MSWKLYITDSQQRALDLCHGSMDKGTGWGYGFGYGRGNGADGLGWGINSGKGSTGAADLCGDGSGGRGDGFSSTEWS